MTWLSMMTCRSIRSWLMLSNTAFQHLGRVYEFLAMRKAATKVTAAVKVAWSLS